METLYPLGPKTAPATLTLASKAYKQRAWLAVAALLFFVLVYFVLAGWFSWTAYRVYGEAFSGGDNAFLNFMVATGAAFLAIFMLKALFFIKRGGASNDVEVTAAEQPRLFEFLYKLADEAGAPRPRRVYLSARVNAAVFYDLSIFNLIFPSRKNLEIGLALVNILTLSEMKAVLAHEFGHFAQRSMAIGSWVYISQQIAEQIVSKRDALDKLLRGISNFDIRVAWIGWLMSLVVWSIRSLMDTLLRLVVLAQRALSRQMEFQADLVAVALTGSDELVHALHKLQAADEAWDGALRFAGHQLQLERLPHDLFAVQHRIIEKIAVITGDKDYGQVPSVPFGQPENHRVFKSGFAQPPQMWSTHPANADRENNVKRTYIAAPHDPRSAWLLFDEVEKVKQAVSARLIGETKAQPISADETFEALNERYSLLQYDSRYRGAYRGRSLTRNVEKAEGMYDAGVSASRVSALIKNLYPQSLAEDLVNLNDLEEEQGNLQALQDKVYQATGGRLIYRGREISRRELPGAIQEVKTEADRVRQRILDHDRLCRGVYLAAAHLVGQGWRDYQIGLIHLLHYSEHTLADLRDAEGLLRNVFAVVTADGKVSSSELKRLLATANALHGVLARIHQQKTEVYLDEALCARLEVGSYAAMIEEFGLNPATNENINNWLGVIDGWVNAYASALSAVYTQTLEQLLSTEALIEKHFENNTAAEVAPLPSRVPSAYSTLKIGAERKRQKKLGLWDRFQVADGVFPTIARLGVAGSIVAMVLGLGSAAASNAKVTIYNGLGNFVDVTVGKQRVNVTPFSAVNLEIELGEALEITSKTADGKLIEHFKPDLTNHSDHYVYNVAAASPLVEWTAVYGNTPDRDPHYIGLSRWLTSEADVFFEEPPASISTKSGGGTRLVISGADDTAPSDVLKVIKSDEERQQLIQKHAQWDKESSPHTAEWKALAQQGPAE